jgi:hypothetical protein
MFVQSLWTGEMSQSYEDRLVQSFPARTDVCLEVGEAAHQAGEAWRLLVSLAFEESLPRYFCADGVEEGCDLIEAGMRAWATWLATVDEDQTDRIEEALCHYNAGTVCSERGGRYAQRILTRLGRMEGRAEYLRRQVNSLYCLDAYTGTVIGRRTSVLVGGGCVDLEALIPVE